MSVVVTSNSAGLLVPANKLRRSLTVINEDGTDNVFIKKEDGSALTVSSTDHDIRLTPGQGFAINSGFDGDEHVTGRYTVIASANTPSVGVFETEDIRR